MNTSYIERYAFYDLPAPTYSSCIEYTPFQVGRVYLAEQLSLSDYVVFDLTDFQLTRHEDVQTEGNKKSSGGKFAHTRLDQIIREREEEFFRELVAEEHSGTHPLQHMVASQHKLDAVGVPGHQVDPHAAAENFRAISRTSPYEQPQVLVEYMGCSATHDAKWRSCNSESKKHCKGNRENGISASATRHRQFLTKTLSAVREQLESTAIDDISAQDSILGNSKGGERSTEVLSAK